MSDDQRSIQDALLSEEWAGALEAWYEALGISVLVLDPVADVVLFGGPRTGFCDGAQSLLEGRSPFECLPGNAPGLCRGGTPFRMLPLRFEGELVARIVVCGFVNSTDGRRAIASALRERGPSDAEVRAIVRGVPVIPKRRIAAIERMVLHQAQALLRRARDESAGYGGTAVLDTLAEAIRARSVTVEDPREVSAWILHHAVRLTSASGACLGLADGPGLSIVAEEGESVPGRLAILQRTFKHGRTCIGTTAVGKGERRSSACVPLSIGSRRIGAICVTVADTELAVPAAHLERFAALAAVMIDGIASRRAQDRQIHQLTHVGEVARVLHAGVEVNDIAPLVAGLLAESLEFGIGGVALTAYGTDRAVVVSAGEVAPNEIAEVVAEAAGRRTVGELEIETLPHPSGSPQTQSPGPDWTVLSLPLTVDDKVIGYLFAARSAGRTFDLDDERLLGGIAAHVAIAFNRSALFERLNSEYVRTVEVLSAALDASEGMQPGHSGHVMEFAMRIGEEMGLPLEDIELLRFAGLVHDIGKIGVSGELLLKPARLSDEEMAEVKRHSEIGATLLEQVGFLNAVAPVVLHHHEHWDGTGYPMELSGEDIPLLARILAAADAYASMTADTPYRRALTSRQAEAEILAASGTQFDPRVVAALTMVLNRIHVAGLSGLLYRGDEAASDSLPA